MQIYSTKNISRSSLSTTSKTMSTNGNNTTLKSIHTRRLLIFVLTEEQKDIAVCFRRSKSARCRDAQDYHAQSAHILSPSAHYPGYNSGCWFSSSERRAQSTTCCLLFQLLGFSTSTEVHVHLLNDTNAQQ